ncbi:hypothetical protein ASPZODRAFT_160310 [Penicilliopsis zonata CBS 506.65]|uniref:Smr domain-containing protein n=1 Tax=Penicilliopsis zonata CBS 506.65 TaxID=1073090 RepID=A0A1L9SE41_9EURO|nr:hypothetical protein ASPZODRAFT_160310 [Penicilliopsis zonata CBS 506.65]OJJ45451.1 hypothetical protein ASPZODRAFT_160310 [Penicilliopsis zonata CBS 506.65]
MGENANDLLAELEKSYCPPLDPALFTAITSDFDLTDPAQVKQLQDTLDTLKLSAWEQEDLPFDPSGTSGTQPLNGLENDGAMSEPGASQYESTQSCETDLTSLASDFSFSLSVGEKQRAGYNNNNTSNKKQASGRVGGSQDDRIDYLAEMFPSIDLYTIQHTLRKCDNDVDRSMDVLLNMTFFDEQQPSEDGDQVAIPKGIDGFGENAVAGDIGRRKGRKRKTKNSRANSQSQPFLEEENSNSSAANNKWRTAQNDIEFILARTAPVLKKETVASTYHAHGASLSAAIRALATANKPQAEHCIGENPVLAAQVAELAQEFSSVPLTTLAGLLTISRNSISAANELAAAMVRRPAPASLSDIIKFSTPSVTAEVDVETPRPPRARTVQDYESVRTAAHSHFDASSTAFNKASAAYRRGKSDRLMGAAAAYYSSVGREHLEKAKRNASAAADAWVHGQSTADTLDLHGVSVQDAVRIASEGVALWWESLGDARYIRGGNSSARQGYRIITGVGRHSHDGTSRIGPAVGKMLAREGWKVEVGEGVLTVMGARQ